MIFPNQRLPNSLAVSRAGVLKLGPPMAGIMRLQVRDATIQLSMSIVAIFVVTTLLLGLDPWGGFITTLTIAMILVDLMGLMYAWDISFNAVSLVNLVMVRSFFLLRPAVKWCCGDTEASEDPPSLSA